MKNEPQGLYRLLHPHLGAQEGVLAEGRGHGLAHLGVVEGLVQVVEARHVLQAEVGVLRDLQTGVGLDLLVEVKGQLLQDVDLALLQRIHLCLRIAQREVPLHAVHEHALAARGARRRLAAGHVLGILQVDGLVTRLELVALEGEGAGTDVFLDLLERIGFGDALGHDEGHAGARLAQRLDHEAVGLAQEDAEGVRRGRVHAQHELHQRRAHGVALAPALQRGDHVLACDRLAVMELQALAKLESPQPLVRAFGPGSPPSAA